MVETRLPPRPGGGRATPQAIARDLRELATRLRARPGDPHGNLAQNQGLATLFSRPINDIRALINVGVQGDVSPVIAHLSSVCPLNPPICGRKRPPARRGP